MHTVHKNISKPNMKAIYYIFYNNADLLFSRLFYDLQIMKHSAQV